MKLLLAKKGNLYIPATDQDREISNKIGQGELLSVTVSKNRNGLLHRKFFALIDIGFDNQDNYTDINLYRSRVMIGIGHCDAIYLEDGTINYIPKSISYDSIPNDIEFQEIYKKTVDFIAKKLHITNEELAEEVLNGF